MISLFALLKSFLKCGYELNGLHTVRAWRTKEEHLKCPNNKSVAAYESHTQNWEENNCNEEERLPLQWAFFTTLNFVNITHTFAYFVSSVIGKPASPSLRLTISMGKSLDHTNSKVQSNLMLPPLLSNTFLSSSRDVFDWYSLWKNINACEEISLLQTC